MELYERHRPPYSLSTDRGRLDIDFVHNYLAKESYWAQGLPLPRFRRAIEHSLNFGLYDEHNRQVGFGRVVTDTSSLAYLYDIFITPEKQGNGLGTWLVNCILEHPNLQSIRTWMLSTKDAHDFYRKFGFNGLENAQLLMQRCDKTGYKRI